MELRAAKLPESGQARRMVFALTRNRDGVRVLILSRLCENPSHAERRLQSIRRLVDESGLTPIIKGSKAPCRSA